MLGGHTFTNNGQVGLGRLAHEQVKCVSIDQARSVALANRRPNGTDQLANRLHARHHAQEQKAPHLIVRKRLLGGELPAKGIVVEHARAGNAALILRHGLVIEGASQSAFH